MSEFKFTTGNQYIDGRIVYSHDRIASGYTVSYSVQMRRNNSWTGTYTHGRISYKVYLNDTPIKSDSNKYYEVRNGGAWYELVSGKHTVPLNATQSVTYTIGFSASTVDGISAFKVPFQKSPGSANTVGSMLTAVGKGSVSIKDTGKNSFIITSKAGSNGGMNNVGGCILFFTTDGSEPYKGAAGASKGVESVTRSCAAGEEYVLPERTIRSDTMVKAFNSTVGTQTVNGTNATDSSIESKMITYYAPPIWSGDDPIKFNCYTPEGVLTTTPNPTSEFRVSWTHAVSANSNSPLMGYNYVIYKNSIPILEKWVSSNVTGFSFSGVDGYTHTIPMSAGDIIAVTVAPYTYWGDLDRTPLLGDALTRPKEGIKAKFEGAMTILVSDGKWKSGQAWVKAPNGWRASKKVFIKTPSGWEESI